MSEPLVMQGISSIIVIAIALALCLFWLKMLIDCANRNFTKPKHQILWILFIALAQALGAFVYWVMVQRRS